MPFMGFAAVRHAAHVVQLHGAFRLLLEAKVSIHVLVFVTLLM